MTLKIYYGFPGELSAVNERLDDIEKVDPDDSYSWGWVQQSCNSEELIELANRLIKLSLKIRKGE